MTSRSLIEDGLLTGITSFRIWLILYGGLLIFIDTVFCTYFPTTVLGTILLTGVLWKFRLPLASKDDVEGFFGVSFRPSLQLDDNLDPTSNTPIQDQPGLTVKSRLLLMRSPPSQLSTSSSNGQKNGQKNGGRIVSEAPLIVVGHRGAGLDAPENSLSAIRECKNRGCEAVEFDVNLTKDNIPVLFHDDNLIRIAGIDRNIKDMTLDELKKVDISIMHPLGDRFRKERVPTFEEAVNLCLSIGMKFIIDLKDDDETVIAAVVSLFQKHQCYSMGIVSSFYVKAVYDVRRRDPKIIGCMAWRPGYYRYTTWSSNWENLEPRQKSLYMDWAAIIMDAVNDWGINCLYWWFVGLSAILFQKDSITREETYRWMKRDVRIYAWTVNSPLEKLHFVQNVQLGYLTDSLDGGEAVSVQA
ncbi:glycerophosphodiester phosphodiesterase 1 isoform X2 [Folsomia candida]|uniref:glycerophosphodiester phosphodiesterase 1 isoform X2 n=1 Tax=Folsomia candida TaxID=158441 RepID=UPI000B8FA65B|nr:glycerophosphodiester phosphodiesterase 1 isoform X2 [Folsomia candida]